MKYFLVNCCTLMSILILAFLNLNAMPSKQSGANYLIHNMYLLNKTISASSPLAPTKKYLSVACYCADGMSVYYYGYNCISGNSECSGSDLCPVPGSECNTN